MQLFVEGSEKGGLKIIRLLNYLRKMESKILVRSLEGFKAAIHSNGNRIIHICVDLIVGNE